MFGSGYGFARATQHLKEVCGWTVAPNTMAKLCYREGEAIEAWRADSSETAVAAFRDAPGEVEMYVDGTMVHTEDGWQEVKVAAVVKRPEGEPATDTSGLTQPLPEPTAVVVRCDIANADNFCANWVAWMILLGVKAWSSLTCFADGAAWIWTRYELCFPDAKGILDIFHLLQHVHLSLKELFRDRVGAIQGWLDSARHKLLSHGWQGLCDWVGRLRQAEPAAQEATEPLLKYGIAHYQHMDYPGQRARGRPVGSGLIEGACKQLVGKRLKQTGARWLRKNVRRMTGLVSSPWAGDWQQYWQYQLAA